MSAHDCLYSRCIDPEHCHLGGRCETAATPEQDHPDCPAVDPKDLAIASLQGQLADVTRDCQQLRRAAQQGEWWANAESRRLHLGRWEFYRDKRDWWIGVFLSERATYVGFLTLIAKRRRPFPTPALPATPDRGGEK